MGKKDKIILTGKIFRHLVLDTLRWFGFAPELQQCVVCGKTPPLSGNFLNLRLGGLVCASCHSKEGEKSIGKNALAALQATSSGKESDEISMSDRERHDLLRFLVDYSQYMVAKPLYSAKVLFQLLRG